jgi:hypothetical protein
VQLVGRKETHVMENNPKPQQVQHPPKQNQPVPHRRSGEGYAMKEASGS